MSRLPPSRLRRARSNGSDPCVPEESLLGSLGPSAPPHRDAPPHQSHFRGGAPKTSALARPPAQREPIHPSHPMTPAIRGLLPATPAWATPCPGEHTLRLTHPLTRLLSRTPHPRRRRPQTPRLLWGPREGGSPRSPRNSNAEPPRLLGCTCKVGASAPTTVAPRGRHSNPRFPSQLSDAGRPQIGGNRSTIVGRGCQRHVSPRARSGSAQ